MTEPCMAFTLGEVSPAPALDQEGAVVQLDEHGAQLFIAMRPENQQELTLLRDLNPMRLGVIDVGDLAFLLVQLGGFEFDCPVHVGWLPPERQPDLAAWRETGNRLLLSIVSVEPNTNIVRGLKACTLSPRVTAKLFAILDRQIAAGPISRADYARACEYAYQLFPNSHHLFVHGRAVIDKAGA